MRVAILGCGYLGRELARRLAAAGHEVVGVRRSEGGLAAIEAVGAEAVRADVTEETALQRVPDADALVFAASSGGRDAEAARAIYVRGLETVLDHFEQRADPPDRLLYTSSTGVYGDHDGAWVDEETTLDPETEKARVLAMAEGVALDSGSPIERTVARLGGLYGPDRYRLDRYLEGPVTAGYLNLIHRDDAAGAIQHLLEEGVARGDVVTVVDEEPVEKWTFADWIAEQVGRDPPPKQSIADRLADDEIPARRRHRIAAQKRCSNERLRSLGYELAYPTFREGYRDSIEAYISEDSGMERSED